MRRQVIWTILILMATCGQAAWAMGNAETAKNPIIWADVPDPSVIRVGDTYYMTSTTMHMNPGVPVMKSTNLVDWEIVNYVYDVLAAGDAQTLSNGQNEYGKGSWASSLTYHDGVFYVVFSSQTAGKTFTFRTRDIENGPWDRSTISFTHDMSLLFDDDGRVYLVHGGGDIRVLELTADATAIKAGGLNQVIIRNASAVVGRNVILPAEGAHIHKINGRYYIFLITWPSGGMRTQICFRSDNITGPYEGRVVLEDAGIAQGGIIDTPDGKWYALLFGDRGAVGRIPYLVPVTWDDGWPIFGIDGKVPKDTGIPLQSPSVIVASDEFNGSNLSLVWQWNHNPDSRYWSLTERPGYLRLINGSVSTSVLDARNTLTQRMFGPECSAAVAVDVSNMRHGDYAGLAAFQKNYGFVGVKMSGREKYIIMVNASSGTAIEVESVPIAQNTVYLKVEGDFRDQRDRAYFYYSFDGHQWHAIGGTLRMSYTMPHFMGYRFALFSFATVGAEGYVDFDWFRVGD